MMALLVLIPALVSAGLLTLAVFVVIALSSVLGFLSLRSHIRKSSQHNRT